MDRKRYFCDTWLPIMWILFLVLEAGAGVFCTLFSVFYPKINEDDRLLIVVICTVLTLIMTFIAIVKFSQCFAYIEIDKEGIRLCNGFKKGKKNVYEVYKHIQIASYNHIYQKRYFIVLSKFALLDNQIEHINDVEITPSIIKLKLNEKTYKALCELLPEKLSFKLKMQKKALWG